MESRLPDAMKERIGKIFSARLALFVVDKRCLHPAVIKESLKAPYGSWEMDKNHEEIQTAIATRRYFKSTSLCVVGVIDEKYVYKVFPDFNPPSPSEPTPDDDSTILRNYALQRFQHEILMTTLAGDCAVPALGRILDSAGDVCGFLMPLEKSITTQPVAFEVPTVSSEFSLSARKAIIDQLVSLVDELHKKDVVHGDINPSNLLLCSDGKLRLCDFQASSPVGVLSPQAFTMEYLSPSRAHSQHSGDSPPQSFADDLYATGISIWAIYSGCAPFADVPAEPEEMLEDVIAAGIRPDLSKIEDEDIRVLVMSYLDRGCGEGSLVGGYIRQPQDTCIMTDVEFQNCRVLPRHTGSHVVHAASCNAHTASDSGCANLYKAAGLAKLAGSQPSCSQCQ